MIDCEENADYLHQEKMDAMTSTEMRTRHFLLDQKGVPATLHWFDEPQLTDNKGRLDPETAYFHFQSEWDDYRSVVAQTLESSTGPVYILIGTDGVIGTIKVEKEA